MSWGGGVRHWNRGGCVVPDCDAPATRRGMCRPHYQAAWLRDELMDTADLETATIAQRLFTPMPWRTDAACRGEGVDLFYPPDAERPEARRLREWEARDRFCYQCPVQVECRDHARDRREYGFWGGESEEERAAAGYPPDMPIGNVARIAATLGREAVS